jgi:hypothetical protein
VRQFVALDVDGLPVLMKLNPGKARYIPNKINGVKISAKMHLQYI